MAGRLAGSALSAGLIALCAPAAAQGTNPYYLVLDQSKVASVVNAFTGAYEPLAFVMPGATPDCIQNPWYSFTKVYQDAAFNVVRCDTGETFQAVSADLPIPAPYLVLESFKLVPGSGTDDPGPMSPEVTPQ